MKSILDYEELNPAHILTFCEDAEDQILYISEAKSPYITVVTKKDQHTEACFNEGFSEDEIRQKLSYCIVNLVK
jgi:hypothetical protein